MKLPLLFLAVTCLMGCDDGPKCSLGIVGNSVCKICSDPTREFRAKIICPEIDEDKPAPCKAVPPDYCITGWIDNTKKEESSYKEPRIDQYNSGHFTDKEPTR